MGHTIKGTIPSALTYSLGLLSLLISSIYHFLNYFNMMNPLILAFNQNSFFSFAAIVFSILVHLSPGLFAGAVYA